MPGAGKGAIRNVVVLSFGRSRVSFVGSFGGYVWFAMGCLCADVQFISPIMG